MATRSRRSGTVFNVALIGTLGLSKLREECNRLGIVSTGVATALQTRLEDHYTYGKTIEEINESVASAAQTKLTKRKSVVVKTEVDDDSKPLVNVIEPKKEVVSPTPSPKKKPAQKRARTSTASSVGQKPKKQKETQPVATAPESDDSDDDVPLLSILPRRVKVEEHHEVVGPCTSTQENGAVESDDDVPFLSTLPKKTAAVSSIPDEATHAHGTRFQKRVRSTSSTVVEETVPSKSFLNSNLLDSGDFDACETVEYDANHSVQNDEDYTPESRYEEVKPKAIKRSIEQKNERRQSTSTSNVREKVKVAPRHPPQRPISERWAEKLAEIKQQKSQNALPSPTEITKDNTVSPRPVSVKVAVNETGTKDRRPDPRNGPIVKKPTPPPATDILDSIMGGQSQLHKKKEQEEEPEPKPRVVKAPKPPAPHPYSIPTPLSRTVPTAEPRMEFKPVILKPAIAAVLPPPPPATTVARPSFSLSSSLSPKGNELPPPPPPKKPRLPLPNIALIKREVPDHLSELSKLPPPPPPPKKAAIPDPLENVAHPIVRVKVEMPPPPPPKPAIRNESLPLASPMIPVVKIKVEPESLHDSVPDLSLEPNAVGSVSTEQSPEENREFVNDLTNALLSIIETRKQTMDEVSNCMEWMLDQISDLTFEIQEQVSSGDKMGSALHRRRSTVLEAARLRAQQQQDDEEGEYDPFETTALDESTHDYVPSAVVSRNQTLDDRYDYDDFDMHDDIDVDFEDDEANVPRAAAGQENFKPDISILLKNPKFFLDKAKDLLNELERPVVEEPMDISLNYSQVAPEGEYEPEDIEKPEPEFHGEPVPSDDDDLFEIAAGIAKPKKKKELVIEEERLPSDEVIEPDYYNADLHIKSVVDYSWQIETENGDGHALMWGGVRSNYGIRLPFRDVKNRATYDDSSSAHTPDALIAFQIKIIEMLPTKHLPFEEVDAHDVRIGYSLRASSTLLGETDSSYCITSLGKRTSHSLFTDYGEPFQTDDIVTAVIDLKNATLSFFKNAQFLGVAFHKVQLPDGDAIFPHIAVKNCRVAVNFGDFPGGEYAWIRRPEWRFLTDLGRGDLERSPKAPESKSNCTILMMVGLPGVGKTTWVRQYLRDHPHEQWTVINAESVMAAMKINGVSRKRAHIGRWDMVMGLIGKSLQRCINLAARRRRNYILDMTNVSRDTRKKRLQLFEEFQRKCVVVIPSEEEMADRQARQARQEGVAMMPPEAMLEMKAVMSIPSSDQEPLEDVFFIEPPVHRVQEAIELVSRFNDEARPWYQKKYKRRRAQNIGLGPERDKDSLKKPPAPLAPLAPLRVNITPLVANEAESSYSQHSVSSGSFAPPSGPLTTTTSSPTPVPEVTQRPRSNQTSPAVRTQTSSTSSPSISKSQPLSASAPIPEKESQSVATSKTTMSLTIVPGTSTSDSTISKPPLTSPIMSLGSSAVPAPIFSPLTINPSQAGSSRRSSIASPVVTTPQLKVLTSSPLPTSAVNGNFTVPPPSITQTNLPPPSLSTPLSVPPPTSGTPLVNISPAVATMTSPLVRVKIVEDIPKKAPILPKVVTEAEVQKAMEDTIQLTSEMMAEIEESARARSVNPVIVDAIVRAMVTKKKKEMVSQIRTMPCVNVPPPVVSQYTVTPSAMPESREPAVVAINSSAPYSPANVNSPVPFQSHTVVGNSYAGANMYNRNVVPVANQHLFRGKAFGTSPARSSNITIMPQIASHPPPAFNVPPPVIGAPIPTIRNEGYAGFSNAVPESMTPNSVLWSQRKTNM